MKTDEEAAAPETEAPAKPSKAPAKAKAAVKAKPAHKATAKANGKGNGKAAVKASPKATPAKAAPKAKAKAPAERKRDPAKLDAYGFRKDSIKSKAAALYAKGKGATLAEVKEALGSVQFNLLTEVEKKGFTVGKTDVKSETGRTVTRYKLSATAA